MVEALYLIVYGVLLISGIYLTFAWGAVARRAYRARVGTLVGDRYLMVATGLVVNSVGMVVVFGTCTYQAFATSVWDIPGPVGALIMAGLLLMTLSKTILVWAVAVRHRSTLWLSYMAISAAWTLFATWWVLG